MFSTLLPLHSLVRWLLLLGLFGSILIALTGLRQRRAFTPLANAWRHWTATIAHIQLMIGMFLYFKSPVVANKLPQDPKHVFNEHVYFREVHISGMFLAVIILTIGSAKARRAADDQAKYRTMFRWFAATLLLLLIIIPWPFSPLTSRPIIRRF